jgi:hypothetical protein
MTVMLIASHQTFFMDKPFYEKHENEIKKAIPYFASEETETSISIQLPFSFPSKTSKKITSNGVEKEESTCRFCAKRVKCLTTNWTCEKYAVNKHFDSPLDEVIAFFESFTTIIYVKGA